MFWAIVITALLASLITSFVEYRKQYNLWDLLKDKIAGFFGKSRKEVFYAIRLSRNHVQAFESQVLGLPAHIRAAIRRRL